jgi:hypothetical protein
MNSETRGPDRRSAGVLPALVGVLLLACVAALASPPARPETVPPGAGPTDTLASADTNSLLSTGERPKLMVVVKRIPEDGIVAMNDSLLETEPIELMLADALRARGFEVVAAATAMQSIQPDQLRRILEGDDRAAVEVGLVANVDVVIAGTLQESGQAPPESAAASATVRLAARAVNAAAGMIVGSALLELTGPATGDALRRRAADSVAGELSASILAAWLPRTNTTVIYAENADEQRVKLLKSTIIQQTDGVDSVITLSLAGRSAEIEVFSSIASDELVTRIDRCVSAIPFVVKNFSGHRLDIRFEDTPGQCAPNRE